MYSAVSCGVAPDISNASKTPTAEISYPNLVTYSCNSGYTPVSGNLSRNCQENGTFSGDPPVCKGKMHIIVGISENRCDKMTTSENSLV